MSQYGDAVTLDEGGWPNGVKAAQPAPSSSAARYTADEVRARARAAGKDSDAAVNAARARGLLKE